MNSDMSYSENVDRTGIVADLPPSLVQFVESVRVLRPTSQGTVHQVQHFPDGRITLMLRITQGSPGSADYRNGDVCVAGPRRHALFKTVAAVPLAVLIRFRPGAASSFLGLPAKDLRDRVIPIEELWGSEGVRFREAVLQAQGVRQMLDEVRAVLVRRTRAVGSASEQIARHAVELMRRNPSAPRIQEVAARLGVTERHLRRTFHASVGVTPKDYSRILRLQRVLHASRTAMNWAQVALDAGYYDQAHMIAEFRESIGVSPAAFFTLERASASLAHSCSA